MTDDTEEILHALRSLVMPVCLVGAEFSSESSCATGTLSYVSLRPPMISTSLSRKSKTYELAHQSKIFSISLLRDDQVGTAMAAGSHGATSDKFAELELATQRWRDVPALADCDAVMWCSLEEECPVGEYVLCVGRVESVAVLPTGGRPLIRFDRRYRAMGDPVGDVDTSTYPL